jgi:hypothetical protein
MRDIWTLATQLRMTLFSAYAPAFQQATADQGLQDLPVGMLFHAYDLHPEPLTAARIQACVPHYHTPPFQERILALAKAGLLHETERDVFILSDDGYTKAQAVMAVIFNCVNGLAPLPEQDLRWLATILWRLVQDSLDSLSYTPAADLAYHDTTTRPPLERVIVALDVLDGFRLDTHFAAASAFDVSPAAIEVLTLIWQGTATSLDGVLEYLANDFPRGYSRDDYAMFAAELGDHGWLYIDDDNYQLTTDGRQVRQIIEDRTDDLFFAAWSTLTDDEQARLPAMLTLLNERLKRHSAV